MVVGDIADVSCSPVPLPLIALPNSFESFPVETSSFESVSKVATSISTLPPPSPLPPPTPPPLPTTPISGKDKDDDDETESDYEPDDDDVDEDFIPRRTPPKKKSKPKPKTKTEPKPKPRPKPEPDKDKKDLKQLSVNLELYQEQANKLLLADNNGTCPFRGCKLTFTTTKLAIAHALQHTTRRTFVCLAPNCGKCFAQKTSATRHYLTTHKKERRYQCDECQRLFSQSSHLKTHMHIHTQERPYKCHVCDKAFIQFSTLHSHLRTHDANYRYRTVTERKEKIQEKIAAVQTSSVSLNEQIHQAIQTMRATRFTDSRKASDQIYPRRRKRKRSSSTSRG